jgi:acetylornithine deacetylase/succinyl-diaminopimelate desuccinylase-like protein
MVETSSLNIEKTISFIETQFTNDALPALQEYITIDNLSPSFDKEWATNGKLEKAAEFLLKWASSQNIKGFKGEVMKDQGLTPIIFIEIEGEVNGKSAFMYGHFDKQPHFTGWSEGLGPLLPVIRGDLLYGRGGADDGYAIFSSVLAVKNLQDQGIPHGRVVILIEGSEESGSIHLMTYVNKLKDRIGQPNLCICLDSGCLNYDQLWLTTSLRGVVNIDLTVQVLNEAIHSGEGTGIAVDSFMIVRNLLDRIEDSSSGKVIDEFQVEIPKNRIEECRKVAAIEGDKVWAKVKFAENVRPMTSDNTEILLNNTWRPTVAIVGASGLPEHSTAGNVLRASTTVRVSMRLPPTYDSQKAAKRLVEILEANPPFNCKVTAKLGGAGAGWNSNDLSQQIQASLKRSADRVFGREIMSFGMGGSIPFIKQLGDNFPNSDFLVLGLLGPGSNAHSINECLNIPYCKKLTVVVSHTLGDMIGGNN